MRIVHLWDQCGYVPIVKNINIESYIFKSFFKFKEYGVIEKLSNKTNNQPLTNLQTRSVKSNLVKKRLEINRLYLDAQTAFIKREMRSNSYFEIHDWQLVERFPNLVSRFIFHAHGSEIRRIERGPVIVDTVNEITEYGLRNSALSLYSTPDLEIIVKKYSKNFYWAPHPILPPKKIKTRNEKKDYVFFQNSWDTGKGAKELLDKISEIKGRSYLPKNKLIGLEFGEFVSRAKEIMDGLIAPASHKAHIRRIQNANGVVSQGYGYFGVSDLEGMNNNENFFVCAVPQVVAEHYGCEPSTNLDQLEDFLNHPNSNRKNIVKIVLDTHSINSVSNKLKIAYASLN